MDPRLQLRVQRYGWDAASDYYDSGWNAQLRPAQDTLMKMSGLKPGMSVIETACGTGMVTRRIVKAVQPGGRVLATDLSERMVEELRNAAYREGWQGVEADRMAVEDLNVPDATFDSAICALGLMYTPDPRAALQEMARVVKPGGRINATVWGERKNCGWAEVFPIVDARVASEVCPMFYATGAPGALRMDFELAGLRNIEEHRQSELLYFADAEAVTDSVLMGGPVALAVKRFPDDIREEVWAEFLQSVSDFRANDGSYHIPGEFVTISAMR